MASEALVENNPQIFGDDVLLDDLDDETRSKIYGAVYDVLSNNMSKMRELKKLSKPEKTLQSMKEGKGIDISIKEKQKFSNIDEAIKMMEKGNSSDELLDILKM